MLAAALGRPPVEGTGTFLQFWRAHLDWDEARWLALFGYLETLRMREVVIQWTRYDGIDYGALSERVMKWADGAGVGVWVGLAHEAAWWREASLPGVAERHIALAAELGALRRRRSFRGWYLPEEIEERRWGGRTEELRAHLRGLHKRLRPLAVSGFWNGSMEARVLGRWWKRAAGVDRVLFQDGLGGGPMRAQEWPGYLQELRRSLGKRLTVVVEVFTREAGEEFRAHPADWSRVEWQLRVAGRGGVAFSVPEYATPLGGEAAGRLYEDWIKFLSRQ